MPTPLKKTFLGSEVIWETFGFEQELAVSEKSGGIFDLASWGTVKISGPDAKDYLQRMSTVDVKSMSPGAVRHGAFLTGKGTVVCLGMLLFVEGNYFWVFSPGQAETAFEHIEKFHFAENFQAEVVSRDWALMAEWCPEKNTTTLLHAEKAGLTWQWRDDSRPQLKWIWAPRNEMTALLGQIERSGAAKLGYRLFEYLRIQAGVPQWGTELTGKEIILESNFDQSVARNKGCYPGQEVVERIFTYGQVNKKLFKVAWSSGEGEPSPLPLTLEVDGKPAAVLASACLSPGTSHHGVGLAFVHKNYWEFKDKFHSPNGTMTLTLR